MAGTFDSQNQKSWLRPSTKNAMCGIKIKRVAPCLSVANRRSPHWGFGRPLLKLQLQPLNSTSGTASANRRSPHWGVRSPVIETRITALEFHLWHCVRATSSRFAAKTQGGNSRVSAKKNVVDFTAAKSKESIHALSGSCVGQQQNQKSPKHAFPCLATVLLSTVPITCLEQKCRSWCL